MAVMSTFAGERCASARRSTEAISLFRMLSEISKTDDAKSAESMPLNGQVYWRFEINRASPVGENNISSMLPIGRFTQACFPRRSGSMTMRGSDIYASARAVGVAERRLERRGASSPETLVLITAKSPAPTIRLQSRRERHLCDGLDY